MIDRRTLAVKFTVNTPSGDYLVYIPDMPKARVDPITPALGCLFSQMGEKSNAGIFLVLLQSDIDTYIDMACEEATLHLPSRYKKMKEGFYNFMSAALLQATVITPDLLSVPFIEIENQLIEQQINYIKGSYLFFYIMLRYSANIAEQKDMTDWYTSSTVTDIIDSLKIQSSKVVGTD